MWKIRLCFKDTEITNINKSIPPYMNRNKHILSSKAYITNMNKRNNFLNLIGEELLLLPILKKNIDMNKRIPPYMNRNKHMLFFYYYIKI